MRWTLKYGSRDQDAGNIISQGQYQFTASDYENAVERANQKLSKWRSYPYSGLEDQEWVCVNPLEERSYKKETKDQYLDDKIKDWKLHLGPFEYFACLEAN